MHVTVTTPGTPLWLTFLTLAISVSAVMISLWHAIVNNSERKLSRVQMVCRFFERYYSPFSEYRKRVVIILVENMGREATTVTSIWVGASAIELNGANNLLEGPPLPYSLPAYSNVQWAIEAELIEEGRGWVSLYFGHGIHLKRECEVNRPEETEWTSRNRKEGSGKD